MPQAEPTPVAPELAARRSVDKKAKDLSKTLGETASSGDSSGVGGLVGGDFGNAGGTKVGAALEAMGYVTDAPDDDALADASVNLPRKGVEDLDEEEIDQMAEHRGPTMDWGATVYLSNDDSMSLASAQRVIHAAQNRLSLSPRDIRPHELLNYFNFDTAEVPASETFSLQGSAVLEDDTFSLALAVKGATPERQALDLSLVIDRSCSMEAEGRMSYTRRGLEVMTEQLERGDRIDVVLFDSGVCTPLENYVVGRDDPALLADTIASIQPTSSTNLDAGLREAWRIHSGRDARDVHGRNRRVMLLTDAMLNTGNINEDLVSEVGRQFESNGIRMTGVGVGREFNDTMLDKLTEKGKGAYVYLGSEAVVDRVFGPGFPSLVQTIAHDVRFSLELPSSLAMERFYGEESSTDPEDVMPINYYAGTSQLFLQDLRARDLDPRDPIVVNVAWRDATTGEPDSLKWKTSVGALLDGDSRNVHKARALIAWSDVLLARALGSNGCAEPLESYVRAARQVADDAELAFVDRLTEGMCGVALATVAPPGVAYKVRVDSDTPIAGVALACGRSHSRLRLSGGDTVARFDDAVAGACTLVLEGAVAMEVAVDVPSTGGDVRCVVRGGRASCG
jgi:Ca-activated chloride channel family protein